MFLFEGNHKFGMITETWSADQCGEDLQPKIWTPSMWVQFAELFRV